MAFMLGFVLLYKCVWKLLSFLQVFPPKAFLKNPLVVLKWTFVRALGTFMLEAYTYTHICMLEHKYNYICMVHIKAWLK